MYSKLYFLILIKIYHCTSLLM
ncbi:hypothetical protein Zm00014a_041596 [Zea mays]|uniref:Uncharacterized protein n=1 Tax=Zea mays TaxID=4577 RepID=A0A3L6FKQ0_MAIZE|nr:hypothetical protein Zm00014a_041596 [Zea mays]